jgi:predicted amidohydrolase YtcJ
MTAPSTTNDLLRIAAIHRWTKGGYPDEAGSSPGVLFSCEPALGRRVALCATGGGLITSDDAFASLEEKRRGRIERGDYADLTVIRENLFELPEDCLAAATVVMAITNGQIAFEGQQAYPPGHATCPSGAAPAP